ncbi:hypothetical protein Celaphus_00001225, partial [Cervus elaphus hippelaphus]
GSRSSHPEPPPHTHTPGSKATAEWGRGVPYPPLPWSLAPPVWALGVLLERCAGGSLHTWGVRKPRRSQSPAVWWGRAPGERSESSSWIPGSARSLRAAR